MSKLREAAIALYDRWDSPLWKDLPATARYMQDLCEALNEPDRMETEYQAATLRIDNDLMVIAELTAERDAYAKCADDMAAAHKVERDELNTQISDALGQLSRLDKEVAGWRSEQKENLKNQCELFGQLQQALVERDALKADAERYRYLRSKQMQYSLPNDTVALLVSDVTALDATMEETK